MRAPWYDVIVVGGGSAGCALAARLSEDPGCQVLLLEGGPDPQPIPDVVAKSSQQAKLLLESPYLRMYPTQRKADGSEFISLSGAIMGGGSSVNVMSLVRPPRADLDSWGPEWSYEALLPLMKRIEADQDFPDSPIHGADGPIYIKRPFTTELPESPPVRAFVERALAMGLPLCPDANEPDPFGVGASPYNIKAGLRQSTTVAYLDPARGRPNLHIVPEAPVTRLRLQGSRVAEVEYRGGSAHADRVVLCAGVYHSPQILQLSGIGPEAELRRLGIAPRQVLSGVGENYQDHAVVYMTFEGPSHYDTDWVVPRFRVFWKSDPSLPCANFHIVMRPPAEVQGLKRMMPVSAALLEQREPGRVYLVSADPDELPAIDSRMLEHPDDVRHMLAAMRFIRDLTQHESMRAFYGPLLQPGPDEDWARFARSTYDSYHHGVGTCKMGPASDPTAVVDERLRVHGLDNLWIADASVMPRVTHANTNLAAILIGERAAELIRQAR